MHAHVARENCEARPCRGCAKIFPDRRQAELHEEVCAEFHEAQFDRAVSSAVKEVDQQLCNACRARDKAGKACSVCKSALRTLQLKWHPDKNLEALDLATAVFRYVQSVWEGTYVGETFDADL